MTVVPKTIKVFVLDEIGFLLQTYFIPLENTPFVVLYIVISHGNNRTYDRTDVVLEEYWRL